MIRFLLGTAVGGIIGVVSMCLCALAGRTDEKWGMK